MHPERDQPDTTGEGIGQKPQISAASSAGIAAKEISPALILSCLTARRDSLRETVNAIAAHLRTLDDVIREEALNGCE